MVAETVRWPDGDAEWHPGGRPLPDYTLVRRLGRGGVGEAWHAISKHKYGAALSPYPSDVLLNVIDEKTLTNPNNAQEFKLCLIGDPYVALRNFDCDQYWEGEVTVPLTVNIK